MQSEAIKQPINLYTEASPNPNSLKFVANKMLVSAGEFYDFPSVEDTADVAPLAKLLFENFSFVQRVFYMNNFVTITKDDKTDWYEVKQDLQQFIKSYLQEEKPIIITSDEKETTVKTSENDMESQIKLVLDEYVRPAVETDGGAITFESYLDGVVTVMLQGACSGCPSSTITLKNGIENLLKRMVPEVKEVVALAE